MWIVCLSLSIHPRTLRMESGVFSSVHLDHERVIMIHAAEGAIIVDINVIFADVRIEIIALGVVPVVNLQDCFHMLQYLGFSLCACDFLCCQLSLSFWEPQSVPVRVCVPVCAASRREQPPGFSPIPAMPITEQ